MAAPLTNLEFAEALATFAGITDPAKIAALKTATDEWNGGSLSNAVLSRNMSAFEALVSQRDSDLSAWAQGTATAVIAAPVGQPAPGWYPIRIQGGATVWMPSPAKLAQDIAKGDKGDNARTDILLSTSGPVGAGEIVQHFKAGWPMAFSAEKSQAVALSVRPDAPTSMTITVDGAVWLTATWAAGDLNGALVFAGEPEIPEGAHVRWIGPAIFNSAFSGPSITLAGE